MHVFSVSGGQSCEIKSLSCICKVLWQRIFLLCAHLFPLPCTGSGFQCMWVKHTKGPSLQTINLAFISNLAYPFFDTCAWYSVSSRAVPGDYITVTLVHGRLSCPYLPPPTAQRNQRRGLCFKFCSVRDGMNPSSGFPWVRWNSLSSPAENTDMPHRCFPVGGTCQCHQERVNAH